VAGNLRQRVAGQPERRPFIHRLRADLFVKIDRKLVPVEDGPVDTTAIALDRDSREGSEQSETNSVLSRGGADEQILQINPALAEPGGIVMKEKREAGGLVAEVGDQDLGSGSLSEQSIREILFSDRRLDGAGALVIGELEDELTDERYVFPGCGNDSSFGIRLLHPRIIRLAESGVNAIFDA
jgi:hypothetical protein